MVSMIVISVVSMVNMVSITLSLVKHIHEGGTAVTLAGYPYPAACQGMWCTVVLLIRST